MNTPIFHCDIKDLCQSCVLVCHPFQCCYQEFLLTQRECNYAKCLSGKACPHKGLTEFKNRLLAASKALNESGDIRFKNPATMLPSAFIPEIMPMKKERIEAISIAKNVGVPIIAVSMQNFFRGTHETLFLRKAKQIGLHRFFNYSGEIVLTTDVHDRLCDCLVEYPQYFQGLVEQLNPDYVTTLDTYTHSNVPACVARVKMLEAVLSSRVLLDLKSKVIGLALGATPFQVYTHVDSLMKMGCRIVAFPVFEFRKFADNDSIRWRLRISQKLCAKSLLLSCSAGVSCRMRVYSNYYSTWSWFSSISSKVSNAHEKRRLRLRKMLEFGKSCSEQIPLKVD